MKCAKCQFENLDGAKFCNECGHRLAEGLEAEKLAPETEGERKQVTVLFSDLSGYTAMSEKLDPEELKEIMSRIFGEISRIVTKYEGFIEKFIGDAVVALFGVPKAHEDDPIRAIRAAREIHELVEGLGPQLGQKTDQPLRMHTGIDTGLVVTGEVDPEKGTHGVSGETLNLASRLSGLAQPGEIMIGSVTYSQAEGYFAFEGLGPTKIRGKAEPIQAYRVLSPKEEPSKIHRLHGMRVELIGRKVEMALLGEALERLREREGTIFSICGDAGTGKSRLVEEFKATLDPKEIQWREGHCYAYCQSIPYFPLIDLLNRAWQIEEGDPPEKVRTKVESGIEDLVGKREGIVPYIGSLYALSYPEIEQVSPEFWRSRLQEAIREILLALTQTGPTVICLEDIHWADPSSLGLLRFLLSEFTYPALFVCVYRAPFSLFTSHELSAMGKIYQEIRLQDLSSSEAYEMMESLLKTKTIPSELQQFLQETVEGNPFYLEEMINSLIESETLIPDNGGWKLKKPISESDIPSTIQGVISGRLDRLENETKRILQEASVIGRAFLYELLKRITKLKEHIDRCLGGLEQIDMIRTKSLEPDLEYIFKHALIQEVAYGGLLRKQRQQIHERIGLVIEKLFRDRLSEFYETLAFHFKQGQSLHKAIDYLIKSGEKSLAKYSLDESDHYFREAFQILSTKSGQTKSEKIVLGDLLLRWSLVFHWRGAYRELVDLLKVHKNLAEALDDKAKLGMFYAYLGFALNCIEELKDSYQYLIKALELGEEIENDKVVGYACARLARTCADLGFLEEAIVFGKRAREISRIYESDLELFIASLVGMGYAYFFRGESKKAREVGNTLLEYGQGRSEIRSTAMGYQVVGWGHLAGGDFPLAIESFQNTIEVSTDPMISYTARFLLGISYISNEQFQEGENVCAEVVSFSKEFGADFIGTSAQTLLGIVSLFKGNLSGGARICENMSRIFLEKDSKYRMAILESILARVYLQILQRAGPKSLSFFVKNIGFLTKNILFASKKAENHFNNAIEISRQIGAKGLLGQSYLGLGLLHKAKKRTNKARECISTAVSIFEQCEAEAYLKQAKETLQGLA